MPEPKGSDVRTLAVRVSPDYHAQLTMVAQVDGMSLTDLMMKALDNHMAARREAPDFKAKVQQALEDAEAQMA
jgi:predicted HicB family RNase H-like nuclease